MHFCICISSSDISVEFTRAAYAVVEGDGPLQPVLQLYPSLKCCSVSVTVKLKNITAKSKHFHMYICMYSMYVSCMCICKYMYNYT